jgi:RES domain-containing protein
MTAAPSPTWRLIPSRFPPIAAFATVASADDLAAVMELEGWTNDRLVAERLARLPREAWVFGTPNASVVMAAFLHAAPAGGRFNGPELGAWYAAAALTTSVAEVAWHLRREAIARNLPEARRIFRCYTARAAGTGYLDIRAARDRWPGAYAPDSYVASQAFGEAARAAGRDGILYDSLRHAGGHCVAVFRPRLVQDVVQAAHYDILVPTRGKVVARRLGEGAQA